MKTFWSIRNLSKNSQIAYSKYLRRLNKVVDLDKPRSVEEYILGISCSNKSRTNYLIAYGHYCKANGIEWKRVNLRKEVFPVKVPTEIFVIVGR